MAFATEGPRLTHFRPVYIMLQWVVVAFEIAVLSGDDL